MQIRSKASELKAEDLDVQNQYGSTPILIAAWQNNTDKVRDLVNAKADVNIKNNSGSTAIMYAAAHKNLEMVRCLIEAKADLEITNKIGRSAFECALTSRRLDILCSLLDAGAIIRNSQEFYDLLKKADQDDPKVVWMLWTLLKSVMKGESDLYALDYRDLMTSQPLLSAKIEDWKKREQSINEATQLPDELRHIVLDYDILPLKRGFFGNKTVLKQSEASGGLTPEAKPKFC